MYRNWTGRNVDLVLLREYVKGFLKELGFDCKERCVKGDVSKKEFGFELLCGRVSVGIFGFPDNFTVDFNVASRRSSLLASSFSFLGAGAFVLYDSRVREVIDEVEKRFWIFVEDVVAKLENSAKGKC